jgi:hypothetical protein
MAARYEVLCKRFDEPIVRRFFSAEELANLDEFLAHGRAVKAERERAAKAGTAPDFITLVRGWGGVRLVYRKNMEDSPAYRLNHEEVVKALEEGELATTLDLRELVPDGDDVRRSTSTAPCARSCSNVRRRARTASGRAPARSSR